MPSSVSVFSGEAYDLHQSECFHNDGHLRQRVLFGGGEGIQSPSEQQAASPHSLHDQSLPHARLQVMRFFPHRRWGVLLLPRQAALLRGIYKHSLHLDTRPCKRTCAPFCRELSQLCQFTFCRPPCWSPSWSPICTWASMKLVSTLCFSVSVSQRGNHSHSIGRGFTVEITESVVFQYSMRRCTMALKKVPSSWEVRFGKEYSN